MDQLITANLRSRPTRTLISVFAVAMGVILMLVIQGMTSGTLNDSVNRTMGVGADFILQSSDTGILFALGSGSMQQKLGAKIKEIPGVGAVTPILSAINKADVGLVFGIDLPSYDQFPGSLQIIEGKRSLQGNDVIVDQLFARTHKVKPGMTLKISDHDFVISGICREGAVVREFVPLQTFQTIRETQDKVSMFFIKTAPGANSAALEADLKKVFVGYHVMRADDAAMMLQGTKIPLLKEFSVAVIVISMLISFMVILLAMYTTIFERTREIGILKSLGASRLFVVSMVLRESVLVCFLGVLLGTGISEIIRKVITTVFPTLQVQMTLRQVGFACLLGIVAGLLGALYPAYKAARMDPVKALSYE